MYKTQGTENAIGTIARTIDSFERMVMRHQIISYETVFESGSIGFVTHLDRYKKSTPTEYSFDFTAGTGIIKSTGTGTEMWELAFSAYDIP